MTNPLSRNRARSEMEASCRRTVDHLRFRAPSISHAVTVFILGLSFYSEDLGGVVDAINVFLFTERSPSAGLEDALLAQLYDAILGGNTLTSFADTSLLLKNQRVEPSTSWEAVEKQLKAWWVFCHIFLGDTAMHPAIYKVGSIIEDTSYVGRRL